MTETVDNQQQDQQPDWVTNPDLFDPERAWNLIQNLRVEVDQRRAKVEELESATAAANARVTEAEQQATRLEDLRRENEELRAEHARRLIRNDAIDRKLPDPDLLVQFVDRELWAIDAGAAWEQLKADKPSLFRTAAPRKTWFGWPRA